MNDDETRRQLAQAAKTAQTVNLAQNMGAFIGFFGAGALWMWLTYPLLGGGGSIFAWWGGALLCGFVGAIVVSRMALSLLAR